VFRRSSNSEAVFRRSSNSEAASLRSETSLENSSEPPMSRATALASSTMSLNFLGSKKAPLPLRSVDVRPASYSSISCVMAFASFIFPTNFLTIDRAPEMLSLMPWEMVTNDLVSSKFRYNIFSMACISSVLANVMLALKLSTFASLVVCFSKLSASSVRLSAIRVASRSKEFGAEHTAGNGLPSLKSANFVKDLCSTSQ